MTLRLSELFGTPIALDVSREKKLRGVQPSAGIQAWYRRQLEGLIDDMAESVAYWINAAFKKKEPAVIQIAQDDMAATILTRAIERLRKRWLNNFDDAAQKLAKYFALKVSKRSDAALRRILKDAGFSIDFKLTKAQRDVLNAAIQENVALIKSIPQQFLTQVEGSVMRSVQTGRDLKQLNDDLLKIKGVTKRRAVFIARDQNNKATATLTRTRQLEVVGSEAEAIWVHSTAGKEPRPTHLKAGREKVRYKVSEGWFDPDPKVNRFIYPGELINCRCFSKLVVKGFS